MEYIALVNALISGLEILIPEIQKAVKAGTITPEEQQKVLDAYNSLKNRLDGEFQGPEWDITP